MEEHCCYYFCIFQRKILHNIAGERKSTIRKKRSKISRILSSQIDDSAGVTSLSTGINPVEIIKKKHRIQSRIKFMLQCIF
jgi:hypothetical protein